MDNLPRLFRLLEVTRSQPQYGYALAGIPKSELSDLAQHHYLVTAMAWQLARRIKKAGGNIDIERTLEISLVHDLGELFGGDIAMPYAKANPEAAKLAKQFEEANQHFMAEQFGEDKAYIEELMQEARVPHSAEGVTAKIADYMEVTHFKLYANRFSEGDLTMVAQRMDGFLERLEKTPAQKVLTGLVEEWMRELSQAKSEELFEHAKNTLE